MMHGSTASQDGKRENDLMPWASRASGHLNQALGRIIRLRLSGHVAVGAGTLIWRDLQKFQRDITEGRPAVN